MTRLILSAVLLCVLGSCSKEQKGIPFEECNGEAVMTDSLAVVKRLIGTWAEVYQPCGWWNDSSDVSKKIKIQLRNNGTFAVSDHGQIITQGNWQLSKFSNTPIIWMLKSNPNSIYISGGAVFFCGNNLKFSGTFIANNIQYDGCAKYYYRMN